MFVAAEELPGKISRIYHCPSPIQFLIVFGNNLQNFHFKL
jgi:hypothetical protein